MRCSITTRDCVTFFAVTTRILMLSLCWVSPEWMSWRHTPARAIFLLLFVVAVQFLFKVRSFYFDSLVMFIEDKASFTRLDFALQFYTAFLLCNIHSDKTRVQVPAKMFPHLKLLCWLFMGPTLNFDTKHRNSFLIKFGVFYNKNKILTILFIVKYEKNTLFDEFLVLLGPIISRFFCMFKWGKKWTKTTKGACSSPISMVILRPAQTILKTLPSWYDTWPKMKLFT